MTALALLPAGARADTVASLLGNFTINQFAGLKLHDNTASVRYSVVFGQLPALRELHLADADGDGVTTQAERDAYLRRLAPSLAEQLRLTVDGVAIPLHATGLVTSLPTEQGGFSLRLDVDLQGTLPDDAGSAPRELTFANENYAGRFGWQEISVDGAAPIRIFSTDAFANSLTAGLTESVQELPASGPLAERVVHLTFTKGSAPAGAQMLQLRPGTIAAPAPAATPIAPVAQPPGIAATAWLQRATHRLVDLISGPDVPMHIALFALLAAVVLGTLHAFSPGHGKAVVGAYLIGSRSTARHALFLGITVTITHTLGVFALGFATLLASQFVVPERLLPLLALVSGLLVLGMGIVLLAQRSGAVRAEFSRRSKAVAHSAPAAAASVFRSLAPAPAPGSGRGSFVLAHVQGHAHAHHHHHDLRVHQHGADHRHHGSGTHAPPVGMHSHGGATHAPPVGMHSHRGGTHSHLPGMHAHGGGAPHSHLPPGATGDAVTWRSLLALGISGGLVPCPSAMVLLLAAVALNRTAYGLLLVLAFSAGLALTLTGVGFAFLHARDRLGRSVTPPRWIAMLPVLSAGAITLLGILLCYGALTGGTLL